MAILYIFHAETSTGQNYECNRHDYICYRQELYTFRHALITLWEYFGINFTSTLGAFYIDEHSPSPKNYKQNQMTGTNTNANKNKNTGQ